MSYHQAPNKLPPKKLQRQMSFEGDNSIIILGGANMDYGEGEIDKEWKEAIMDSDVLLLQREIPDAVNINAMKAAAEAKKNGSRIKVILDFGGSDTLPPLEMIAHCDIVSPNKTEALRLFEQMSPSSAPEVEAQEEEEYLLKKAELFLRDQHAELKILFKLGSHGSAMVWIDREKDKLEVLKMPACKFSDYKELKKLDTTGAGDTFTAAYAVNMAEQVKMNQTVDEASAMKFATMSAFLCITRFGAMPSIPTVQEVEDLSKQNTGE